MIAGAQPARLPFASLYTHGFCRVAVVTPAAFPAQPSANARETIALAAAAAVAEILAASATLNLILMLGAPLRIERRLFNSAVVIHRGGGLGVAPTSYIPSYREFYERRQVSAAGHATALAHRLLGPDVPFGTDLIFEAPHCPGLADASASHVSAEAWIQELRRNVP